METYRRSGGTAPFVLNHSRSQLQRGLRRRSSAARLLRLWLRIPPGAWMSAVVSVVFCQVEVSSTGWITRPEESYRVWCVDVCDIDTSIMKSSWPTGGLLSQKETKQTFLTKATDGGERSSSRPGRFTPVRIKLQARWAQQLVWTILQKIKSLAFAEIRVPDRSASN